MEERDERYSVIIDRFEIASANERSRLDNIKARDRCSLCEEKFDQKDTSFMSIY